SGNFSSDVGTWTVDSGDQVAFAYSLEGKTMTMSVFLSPTSVSGAPAGLRVTVPGGFSIARGFSYVCGISAPDATLVVENLSATVLNIRRASGAAFTNTTNSTSIAFTVTFSIV